MELGFDSQSVVRFIGEVESELGIKLDLTALINYPNVNALFQYLNEKMQNESGLKQRKAHVFSAERVAVTGMACRFPDASDTEQFFSNLYGGALSVTSFPSERSALCGTGKNFQDQKIFNGGYIRDIELFDNAYFNISAEEAAVIDPQQRLLMQEIVHAFEDADISADDIANVRIGMFVGVSNFDYLRTILRDEKSIGSVIGNSMAMLSNRMSYLFDLRGPSLTIDTACSSSLVAVSEAVDSICRGACDIAVAAGVNLIIDPEINLVLAEAGMLSQDGLCHTFDQRANGYVRGEGVGVVVLRGLSSARSANNRIYAEIVGKAINQDGRSASITAPNKNMQIDLIQSACENAGVPASEIRYIETHGTGTLLGDYIEISAIDESINKDLTRKDPLLLGAVKTNIGHLESAAGIASFIKVALCLYKGMLVPTIGVETVSEKLGLAEKNMHIVSEPTAIAAEHFLCGISSFGFGGTNCHIILDRCSFQPEAVAAAEKQHCVVAFSANTEQALTKRLEQVQHYLETEDIALPDLEYTTLCRGRHDSFRLCCQADSQGNLSEKIAGVLKSNSRFRRIRNNCNITLLFSGQGTQWIGMANQLDQFPAYREMMEKCIKVFREIEHCDLEQLLQTKDKEIIADSYYAQPIIFSVQVSLAALLKSLGISFNTVCGHSLGEIAAAYVCGAISLASAAKIIHHRSIILRRFTGKGKMLSVSLHEEEALRYLDGFRNLSIGVKNAKDSVVISGDTGEIERVKLLLEADGVRCRFLPVNYAFHYVGIEPYQQELIEKIGKIRTKPTEIRFISSVTGNVLDTKELDATYWAKNMRCTVRFSEAAACFARESDIVIEAAPSSALLYYLEEYRDKGTMLVSLQKRRVDPVKALLEAVSELYEAGCNPLWKALIIEQGNYLRLPAYAFSERQCWYHSRFTENKSVSNEKYAEKTYAEAEVCETVLEIVRNASCAVQVPGPDTCINDLELDSLKMFQLNAKLKSVFNVSLTFSELSECTTISDIVQKICSGVSLRQEEKHFDSTFPEQITEGQLSIIRDQFINSGSNKYNLSGAWRMPHGIQKELWKKACIAVISRYGVLNVVFVQDGNRIVQRKNPEQFTVRCTVVPEGTVPKAYFSECLNAPFDLSRETVRCVLADYHADWFFGLSVHHCVIDGVSVFLLLKEIAETYQLLADGKELHTEPDLSFFEYQRNETNFTGTAEYQQMLSDLREQVKDCRFSENLRLPAESGSTDSDEQYVLIGSDQFAQLRAYSKAIGYTLFEVLYSVYMLLFYKLTGEAQFITCTYSSGRENSGYFDTLGYFVKLLLISCRVDNSVSMENLIADIHRKLMQAYEYNSSAAVAQLSEKISQGRDSISHVFVYEKAFGEVEGSPMFVNSGEGGRFIIDGVEFEKLELDCLDAQYDLVFMLEECRDNIAFRCHYKKSVYSDDTIRLIMTSFTKLLSNILKNTELPLREYEIAEPSDVVFTEETEPEKVYFDQYLERFAALTPNSIAAVYRNEAISYAELNRKSNLLAGRILKLTGGKNTAVGIAVEKSIRFLVSIFAVLKAGGYYVPLDQNYPKERLQYIIVDSGMRFVIDDGSFRDMQLDLSGTTVLTYTEDEAQFDGFTELLDRTLDDRAYAIYTSGSTGNPKGVLVTHRGISNVVEEQTRLFRVTASDRVSFFASVCFDASVFDILMGIGHGATLVFDTRENMGSGTKLHKFFAENRISVTTLPSSVLASMKNEGLSDLRVIVIAGEPCTDLIKNNWCEGHELFNAYGVTEATIWNTTSKCSADKPVLIGKAVANNQLLVLNCDGNNCPTRVTGELYIGGLCLAEGYIGLPEQNKKRFVTVNGTRFYRTGDLVRLDPSGELEYIARADNQVKIRGFRVEMEEIEKVIQAHPKVENAIATVVRKDDNDLIVCFAESVKGETLTQKMLKDDLRSILPHYMLPDRFFFIDQWILTNSGKTDRKYIRQCAEERLLQREIELPVTPGEKQLAAILEEAVTGTVSMDDTIMELGINSIKVYDLIAKIEEETGAVLQAHELLRDITVKEVAELIEQRGGQSRGLLHIPQGVPIPVSEKQKGIWLASRMSDDSSEFNIPIVLKLSGQLDTELLSEALAKMTERHQILRVHYTADGNQIVGQDDLAHRGILEKEDIRACEDPVERLREITLQMKRLPLSPESFPMYKMKTVQTSDQKYYLMFTIHHFIADGWSVRMFFEELIRNYNALQRNSVTDELALEYQYADIAYTEQMNRDEDEIHRKEEYWKTKLGSQDKTVLKFPSDYKRPLIPTHNGRNVYGTISGDTYRIVKKYAAEHSVTVFHFMTAVLGMLLRRCSGEKEIVLGFPMLGRESSQEQQMIGMFVDTTVAKLDVEPSLAFGQYLKNVSRELSETYAMSSTGLRRITKLTAPVRTSGQAQLFQVMINMISFDLTLDEFDGVKAEVVDDGIQEAKYDYTFYISEKSEEFSFRLNYYSDVYSAETAQDMLDNFIRLVAKVVENDSWAVGTYTLSEDSSPMPLSYQSDPVLGREFFENLNQNVLKNGVISQGRFYPVTVLHEKAKAIAEQLAKVGVRTGDIVGITGVRKPEFVSALLAVLRIGGVFVVIDSQWPTQRQALVCKSAFCSHMLDISETDPVVRCLEPKAKVKLPTDCSYISITSGTTGTPKCIAGHNSAVNHFVSWEIKQFGLDCNDRFAILSGISHDPILRDIFVPLTVGASIVFPDDPDLLKNDLFQYFLDGRITVAHMTPSVAEVLQHYAGKHNGEKLNDLRYIFFGGERLRKSCAEAVFQFAPHCHIVNYYGTTETPQGMVYMVFNREQIRQYDEFLPVGSGIQDVEAVVADENGKKVAVGENGTVLIRTKYLAKGYLTEDGTLKALGEDPSVYDTGDLGRYLHNGSIMILGRKDGQVKRYGHRIELGEIESAAKNCPDIENAKAVMLENELCLFIAAPEGYQIERCVEQLTLILASYMMPDSVIRVAQIPLTANGKTDYRALERYRSQADSAEKSDKPCSDLEKTIQMLWGKILNKQQISVDKTFFEAGGTSMKLLQLQDDLEKYFDCKIPMTELFVHPTIRTFARFISTPGNAEQEQRRDHAWSISTDRNRKASAFMKRAAFKKNSGKQKS